MIARISCHLCITRFLDVDLLCGARGIYPSILLSCTPAIPESTNIDFATCSIDGAPPKQCKLSYSMLELINFCYSNLYVDNCYSSESHAMVGWGELRVSSIMTLYAFPNQIQLLFLNKKCYSNLSFYQVFCPESLLTSLNTALMFTL